MVRTRTRIGLAVAIAALAVAVGCTMKDQSLPGFVGPSELGLSLTITVTPDVLRWDGASRALVVIQARNGSGQPVANIAALVEVLAVDPTNPALRVPYDLGAISARNIVTGGDGRASLTYTAPLLNQNYGEVPIWIRVTPAEGNAASQLGREVMIRLLPPGIIAPPPDLAPDFSFTPSAPSEGQEITFDASLSTGSIATYSWDFGDGSTGSGRVVYHGYTQARTYVATLTIADSTGRAAAKTQSVTVSESAPPTANFEFSPAAPLVNETVFFNATKSLPAAGRTITSYNWNFGDGTTGSGVTVQKSYGAPGSYTVTLIVTDDRGRQGTTSKTVAPAEGALPTADFDFSPTAPATGQAIFFNAAKSKPAAGRRIVSYAWDFGAGTTGSGITVEKVYDTPGTYIVTLTVTDDIGRKGSTSKSVAVTTGGAGGVTAKFTYSPTNPKAGEFVYFNASESTSPAGIVSYTWDYGDGTPPETHTGTTGAHLFTAARTYIVRLTVTDGAGKTATTTVSVVVTS